VRNGWVSLYIPKDSIKRVYVSAVGRAEEKLLYKCMIVQCKEYRCIKVVLLRVNTIKTEKDGEMGERRGLECERERVRRFYQNPKCVTLSSQWRRLK
jgi:hypothetical protein